MSKLQIGQFEGVKMPVVSRKLHFSAIYGAPRKQGVTRITNKFYVVRNNDVSVSNYHRFTGRCTGDTRTPDRIIQDDIDALEAFAKKHGGTWDSGWKKATPAVVNRDFTVVVWDFNSSRGVVHHVSTPTKEEAYNKVWKMYEGVEVIAMFEGRQEIIYGSAK